MWSAGVKLAREGGVLVESRDDEEIVARVRAPGRTVAPTVILYPSEREWDCDCGGRVMPCEHIAAATIFVGPPAESGEATTAGADSVNSNAGGPAGGASPPPPERARSRWRRVVYKLARAEGGLRVSRAIVDTDGAESPLAST